MDAHLHNIQSPNYTLPKNIIISETDKIQELRRFIIGEKFINYLLNKEDIISIAESDSSVLVVGKPGTGKWLVAKAIHGMSKRKDNIFVDLDIAALDSGAANPELFGSCKGRFTGVEETEGVFEEADNGTLFLDEIGDADLGVQIKLRKSIENKVIRRVSGRKHKPDDGCKQGSADHTSIKVDVRVIVATNKDLQEEIKNKRFIDDLYSRIRVCKINLSPLRERREDIPSLISHFITKHVENSGKNIKGITGETLKIFMHYNWPRNVRELENTIMSAMVHCKSDVITPDCLIDTDILESQSPLLKDKIVPSCKTIKEFLLNMKSGTKITNKEIRRRFEVYPMIVWRIMRELCQQNLFQLMQHGNRRSSYYVRM